MVMTKIRVSVSPDTFIISKDYNIEYRLDYRWLIMPFSPAALTSEIRPKEDIKSSTVSPIFHESKYSSNLQSWMAIISSPPHYPMKMAPYILNCYDTFRPNVKLIRIQIKGYKFNGGLRLDSVGWNGGTLLPFDNGSHKLCPASLRVETIMSASCFKSDQVRLALLVESISFFKDFLDTDITLVV